MDVGGLDVPRGATAGEIKSVLDEQQKVLEFSTVAQAFEKANALAHEQDLIVVFGSFLPYQTFLG
ncbi:hypothetical protein P4S73_25445 [Paraglaciecola sp. Hal342]